MKMFSISQDRFRVRIYIPCIRLRAVKSRKMILQSSIWILCWSLWSLKYDSYSIDVYRVGKCLFHGSSFCRYRESIGETRVMKGDIVVLYICSRNSNSIIYELFLKIITIAQMCTNLYRVSESLIEKKKSQRRQRNSSDCLYFFRSTRITFCRQDW